MQNGVPRLMRTEPGASWGRTAIAWMVRMLPVEDQL
jgi:hypothetical protein